MNTSIELPHEGGINALHFQPSMFNEDGALAVTTGRDKKFKLWHLVESSSIHSTYKYVHSKISYSTKLQDYVCSRKNKTLAVS